MPCASKTLVTPSSVSTSTMLELHTVSRQFPELLKAVQV